MKLASLYRYARQAFAAWVDDYAPSMGAALAYYTLFSVAPLLLIVISIAGLVFGPDAARGEIFAELRELMGDDGAAAAQALLQSVNKPAQGVVGNRRRRRHAAGRRDLGLRRAAERARPHLARAGRAGGAGCWTLVRARLLSFGMVLGVGFLLIVSLVASAAVAALGKCCGARSRRLGRCSPRPQLRVSFALVTATFAMIYKIMPRVRIGWRDVWVGAAVTALLFAIGKSLIGLYLGRSASPRGSAPPARSSSCSSGCTTRRRSSCSAPSSRGSMRMRAGRVAISRPAGRNSAAAVRTTADRPRAARSPTPCAGSAMVDERSCAKSSDVPRRTMPPRRLNSQRSTQ